MESKKLKAMGPWIPMRRSQFLEGITTHLIPKGDSSGSASVECVDRKVLPKVQSHSEEALLSKS